MPLQSQRLKQEAPINPGGNLDRPHLFSIGCYSHRDSRVSQSYTGGSYQSQDDDPGCLLDLLVFHGLPKKLPPVLHLKGGVGMEGSSWGTRDFSQDVALKQQSGALHRAALSAPLVDSARKCRCLNWRR